MLGNIDIERLEQSKRDFDFIKKSKLAFVAHKHLKDAYNLSDLLTHFYSEIDELHLIIKKSGTLTNIIQELADVSNMVDLIYDYIHNLRAKGEK